jgi:hypothetical protein
MPKNVCGIVSRGALRGCSSQKLECWSMSKPVQPSLMLESKDRAYLSGAPFGAMEPENRQKAFLK